jgi:hypothetical protein
MKRKNAFLVRLLFSLFLIISITQAITHGHPDNRIIDDCPIELYAQSTLVEPEILLKALVTLILPEGKSGQCPLPDGTLIRAADQHRLPMSNAPPFSLFA